MLLYIAFPIFSYPSQQGACWFSHTIASLYNFIIAQSRKTLKGQMQTKLYSINHKFDDAQLHISDGHLIMPHIYLLWKDTLVVLVHRDLRNRRIAPPLPYTSLCPENPLYLRSMSNVQGSPPPQGRPWQGDRSNFAGGPTPPTPLRSKKEVVSLRRGLSARTVG